MESVLGRYKNLIVLVVVLFAQVFGLAVQVKRNTDTQSTRLIRIWAVSAVTPFEKVLVAIQTGTHNLWHNYFYLRGVRAENRDLKQQIQNLRLEQVRLSEDAEQARRLQALFAFKEQYVQQTIAAQVIGSSGSRQSRIVYIDKGESDGVKADMAVITPDGVVGKVLKPYRSTSQVLLLDDQSSGVGAILAKSRLQGILRGSATGEVMLEKVMSDEQVQPGETVLTSGGDRIFPKGLPVGTVTKVSPGADLFLNIRVRPAAQLGKLEEVLVVTKVVEKAPTLAETGPVRAADILAQRLPSVPDKPAEGTAGGVPAPNAATTGAAKAPTAAASLPGAPDVQRATTAPAASANKPVSASTVPGQPGAATAAPVKPRVVAPSTLKPASAPSTAVTPSPAKVSIENTAAPAKPKPNPPSPGSQDPTPSQDGPPQ
jgi:rod shape-determining protein MreC